MESRKKEMWAFGLSPLLANVYLHYVLDLWVERVVKRHCRGRVYLFRYADDLLLGFEDEGGGGRLRALPLPYSIHGPSRAQRSAARKAGRT